MFPDVYEFTLYMIFVIFQKKSVPEMAIFMKILKLIFRVDL